MAITYMTKEGYDRKMAEISRLESIERPRISRAIAEARDKGDLSENSEYDAAKEAQGMLEMKIAQLKDLVANARIIDESKVSTSEIQMLNRVRIHNLDRDKELEYTIVADSEADMKAKKIAISTPIAQGLLGHKVGDVVSIQVPSASRFSKSASDTPHPWHPYSPASWPAKFRRTRSPRTTATTHSWTSTPCTRAIRW